MSVSNLGTIKKSNSQPKFITPISFTGPQQGQEFENMIKSWKNCANIEIHADSQISPVKPSASQDVVFTDLRLNERSKQPHLSKQQTTRSLRIEDQEIIVVEQQYELASSIGEQSVILQNIRFDYPQVGEQDTFVKIQPVYFQTIPYNYVKSGQENYSDSQCYFSSSQLKPNIRQSKNTCREYASKEEFSDKVKFMKINKSCIAKPMNQEQVIEQQPIKYFNQNSTNTLHVYDINKKSICQTEFLSKQIFQNLAQQITALQTRLEYSQQHCDNLNKIIQSKNMEIQTLNSLIEAKSGQYERIIEGQQKIIKEYEQSQNQNKFSKVGSTLYFSNTPQKGITTFEKNAQSLRIIQSEYQINLHKICRQQIEQLQQYIFDIEQKIAMVSLQMQKRVQLVKQELERQYQRTIESLKKTISNMQEALTKIEQQYRIKQIMLRDRQMQIHKKYDQLTKKQSLASQPKQQIAKTCLNLDTSPLQKRGKKQIPQTIAQKNNSNISKSASHCKSELQKNKKYSIEHYGENHELLLISNKIQRLRYQINKELESIN